MSGSSTSTQESTSTSTSTPSFIETPENAIINQLSGVAAGLAGRMVDWANNVFSQTSRITDQAVGNFFQASNQMLGLSKNLTDQYNNVFAPQNASLAKEANEYNSVARQRNDMGQAGATAQQAGAAALRSSEEALRSYGINPSDGRYAALDKAAAVQNSANTAGAMNQQRERTAQVGRDLRRDAVQIGATMPAAIANVNNTAIQANTGASNATLANANTGANLQRLPNEYLKTAMEVKLPPSGQNTQSQSRSTGQSQSTSATPSQSGGSGGGSSPRSPGGAPASHPSSGGGGQAWMPQHGDAQEHGGGGRGGGMGRQPNSAIMNVPGGGARGVRGDYDVGGITDAIGGSDFSYLNQQGGGGGNDYYQPADGYSAGIGQQTENPFNDFGGGSDQMGFDSYDFQNRGWDDTYGGGGDYNTYGNQDFSNQYGGAFEDGSWGNVGYDAGANAVDTGWGQTYDTPAPTDWGNGADAFTGGGSYDTTSPSSDFYAGDYSGNYDDYGGVFAGGGAVDPSLSPSGGRMVDDVPAQAPGGKVGLNADEFVIPRDVALWKGQEFFQKMIDQSRKARVTAPAQGAQPAGPPRQNQPMMG